jgi:chorismate mutase/prephenate dehydratase
MPTVTYLGPEHTNTHLAAVARFGRHGAYVHAPTVEDVFQMVERRRADYGVVPVENSLEGAVAHTLDRFIDFRDTPVKIQGEIERPIRHCLLVRRGEPLGGIRAVYSHPQALAQCHRWLTQHLPRAERRETASTADAVWDVVNRSGRAAAAIGRRELAAAHRLRAIPIPEDRENKTRFLILGLDTPRKGRRNKTSVLFALKDRPGALHDALGAFKRHRINLTKIESRPSKQKAWEYLFFIDLEGHASEPRVRRALEALRANTSLMRILGSYPALGR